MLNNQEGKKTGFLDTGLGVFLAAILANLLWGSASPCIKLGYQLFQISSDAVMSQIFFAGIRFTMAGILTVALGSIMQRRLLVPQKGSTGMLIALALAQTIVQYTFFYMGLSKAPSYKGSVISPSSVFFAVLLASLVLRQEKLTVRKLLGCVVGFTGVVLISLQSSGDAGGFRWDGEGFLVLAAFSYACSTVSFLAGGRLRPVSPRAWLLMLYLGLLSAVAYTLWSLLLQKHPVSHITVYSFTNPVFGVILSALLLNEGKNLDVPRCLLALLLVSLGVWIVNSRSKEPKRVAGST